MALYQKSSSLLARRLPAGFGSRDELVGELGGSDIADRWVRPEMIVIDPRVFDLLAGVIQRQAPVRGEALVSKAAVERFDERVVGGIAGTGLIHDHARVVGSAVRHDRNELAAVVSQDPLRQITLVAKPLHYATTSSPLRCWSTSMARRSLVKLSTTVRARDRRPSNRASATKSILQTWLGAVGTVRSRRCAAALRGSGRLRRRLSPAWQYSRYTRLWLALQPSRRSNTKILQKP